MMPGMLKRPRTTASDTDESLAVFAVKTSLVIAAWIGLSTILLSALMIPGCVQTRTIFVPPTIPVRLGEDIRGAKVFVPNPDKPGHMLEARADIYAGSWIAIDPAEWFGPDGKPTAETVNRANVKPIK